MSRSDRGPSDVERDVEEADEANGEPAATDERLTGDHATGEQQARQNRENDPPA